MCGPAVHASVEEVEASWAEHLERQKLRPFDVGATAAAYVSDGRWVADCVRCNSGIACWPENPQACCLGCGALYTIEFPEPAAIAEATLVLEARPEGLANWRPDLGEDVADLKVENLVHALPLEPVMEL